MARTNEGPKLKLYRKRGWTRSIYYIVWTDNGRSRERSTGTGNLPEAQVQYANWQQVHRGQISD
jgi:hypothetical protein